jgi:hypothetical protein
MSFVARNKVCRDPLVGSEGLDACGVLVAVMTAASFRAEPMHIGKIADAGAVFCTAAECYCVIGSIRSSSIARCTAAVRVVTSSFVYTDRRWACTVRRLSWSRSATS